MSNRTFRRGGPVFCVVEPYGKRMRSGGMSARTARTQDCKSAVDVNVEARVRRTLTRCRHWGALV